MLVLSVLAIGAAVLLPNVGVHADSNLIANPSFETAAGTAPADWQKAAWGTNTTTFTYETTGHTGSRSATVKVTNYKTGEARWVFNTAVPVTPNTTYAFSDWYKSTVKSSIDAVVTATDGTVSYQWIGDYAVSSSWKQVTANFKAPANAKSVSFNHYIQANGTLTTDDFSLTLPGAPTAPAVNITAPSNSATVSGTTAVTANATTTTGTISSVQFKLDGANLGSADTTSPYSVSWNTTTVANGTHTLTAVATNSANLSTTSSAVSVTVNNPTAPTVSITAPTANATVSGTQDVTANAATASGTISSVQFKLDGNNLGAADTTAPYSVAWDTTTATNGVHTLTAVAKNSANLSTTSTSVSVTVDNPVAPTVSITAPAANSTVSGSQTLTATAGGNRPITSVQFKLDGTNFGAPVTIAPYSIPWDTTTAVNGTHTLTAAATNSANLTTTSAGVTVTVNNVVTPPPTNLVPNPSVETNANSQPTNWQGDSWGTNTATVTYANDGHTGSHSVRADITAYTDGDAKWYFDSVNATAGKTYTYANWYMSNVDTQIDAKVTFNDGTVDYYYVTLIPTSNGAWAQASAQFVAPANAKTITFFQLINKVGYLQADDFSLTASDPLPFNRPLITIAFDDGWETQYTNGKAVLDKYGLPATFYIITGNVGDNLFMTTTMIQTLKDGGNEIASHTVTHPHLPNLTVAQIDQELGNAQTQLRTWFGTPGVAENFATPYGDYNSTVMTEIKRYYRSHRSVEEGYNSKGTFDAYDIKSYLITNTTTLADVNGWIQHAKDTNTWLVLTYHVVDNAATSADPVYMVTPSDLDAQLNAVKQSGVTVKTISGALDELQAQL